MISPTAICSDLLSYSHTRVHCARNDRGKSGVKNDRVIDRGNASENVHVGPTFSDALPRHFSMIAALRAQCIQVW